MKNDKMKYLEKIKVNSKVFAEKIALKYNNESVTYRELDQKSDTIASCIYNQKNIVSKRIGILMNKSFETIFSILGVLKSGCCYVPIDASYPTGRIKKIIEISDLDYIITNSDMYNNSDFMEFFSAENIILIDEINLNEIVDFKIINTPTDSLAYIMFTSGSTGTPKGVKMPGRSLNNITTWQANTSFRNIKESIKTLQLAPISFDVSTQEIFSTFFMGGTLIIVNDEDRKNFKKILGIIETEKINRVFMPPVYLNEIVSTAKDINDLSTLKEINVAGEQLKITNKIRDFFNNYENCKLINQYGPTESHVVTSFQMPSNSSKWSNLPPIGKPIDNVKTLILDENQNQVGTNEWGELYIGGSCLAEGYQSNIEETKKKFIFSNIINDFVYKTGDIVRINENKIIEFKGRSDDQVKIRGHRVELEEIEKILLKDDRIKNCSIIVCQGKYEEKAIVAYLISDSSGKNKLKEELFNYLSNILPEYMIPKRIHFIKEFPLTPNGKVDKIRLTILNKETSYEISTNISDDLEEKISLIWKNVIDSDREVDPQVNFFDQGGNSLLVNILINKLNEEMSLDLTILDFYENSTLNNLLAFIRNKFKKRVLAKERNFVGIEDSTSDDQDIAIIGIGCNFPGAKNPDEYWDNLINGREMLLNTNDIKGNSEKIYSGGTLEGIEYFDNSFFGISNKEARMMDPQHRLFLQCAWEAFEDAGYYPLNSTNKIAVFAGVGTNSYLYNNLLTNEDLNGELNILNSMENLKKHYNNDKDYISTRTSYLLNLKGPSINVQTACSTSLVAIHLACQSLKNNDSDMAIAGASTIILPQKSGYEFDENMVFSHDGKVRPFDKNSTGIVYGDGIGVVLLKPLNKAIRDKDNIYGVIKGSAVNNDGNAKVGFTAPSIEGQKKVLQDALYNAKIDPATVSYIEAHGTGTKVGDAMEVKALKEIYDNSSVNPCVIGSVKSNIGHTSWSSGIAGIIKTVLALKHKLLPPTINVEELNPHLNLDNTRFYLNKKAEKWSCNNNILRAGVSSFGIGGTNAHIILEEFKSDLENKKENHEDNKMNILTLSAKSSKSLVGIVQKYQENIDDLLKKNTIEDICYTANTRRNHFNKRFSIIFNSHQQLKDKLNEASKNINLKQSSEDELISSEQNIAFLFSGNGTQYINMGRELYVSNKYFKESMDYCNEIIEKQSEYSLKNLMNDESLEIVNDVTYNQLSIFSIEYSLAKLWIRLGVRPDVLLGHSLGEFALACIADIFSVNDCIKILMMRGTILKKVGDDLGMISIKCDKSSVEKIINENGVKLEFSAINSPQQVVLSGEKVEINKLNGILKIKNIDFEILSIKTAGHTNELKYYIPDFKKVLMEVKFNQPKIKVISSVTGNIESERMTTISYWCDHLTRPVNFLNAVEELSKIDCFAFIEVGPKPVLLGLAMECLNTKYSTLFLPSLREGIGESLQLFNSISKLYLKGFPITWKAMYQDGKKVSLPTYSFELNKHWISPNREIQSSINNKEKIKYEHLLFDSKWVKGELLNNIPSTDYINQNTYLLFFENENQLWNLQENKLFKKLNYKSILISNCNKRVTEDIVKVNLNTQNAAEFLYQSLGDINGYRIMYFMKNNYNNIFKNKNLNVDCLSNTFYKHVSNIIWLESLELRGDLQLISEVQDINNKDIINIENNMIISMNKILDLEFPKMVSKTININTINPWDVLYQELISNNNDRYVRYNETKERETLILQKHQLINKNNTKEYSLNFNDRSFIITGGFGGIGIEVIDWLIKKGASKIYVISRSTPTTKTEVQIRNWNRDRKIVESESFDITDYYKLDKFLLKLKEKHIEIQGIFHLAGVVDDVTLNNISKEKIEKVLKPKTNGSWNLHILSKKYLLNLEYFVLFSSTASIIGNKGQYNHALANAFMDSLVELRRKEGLKATSINWGAWGQVGHLKNDNKVIESLKRKGFKPFNTKEGLHALDYSLKHDIESLTVLSMDWKKFIMKHQLNNNNYFGFLNKDENLDFQKNIKDKVIYSTKENLLVSIINYIKDGIEEVLGVYIDDVDKSCFDFGMDSLSAIELKNNIQVDFKLKLNASFIYEHNTISKMAQELYSLIDLELLKIEEDTDKRIEVINTKNNDNISSQQKRWLKLIDQKYGERVCPIIFNLELNKDAFIYSLRKIIERHESLSWFFPEGKRKKVKIEFNNDIFIELNNLNTNKKIEKINDIIVKLFKNFPSPYENIPWGIKCIELEAKKFVILLSIQHIDFDGTSISTFAHEFLGFYKNKLYGSQLKLENVNSYSKYIDLQENYKKKDMLLDREFFKGLFLSLNKTTVLPGNKNYILGQPKKAARYSEYLNIEGRKVDEFAINLGVSKFSILLASYGKLISEIVKDKEVIIATIVNGRSDRDFKGTIGPFTAPFPIKINNNDSLNDSIINCNEWILEINSRSNYPVEDLINNVPAFKKLPIETYFSDVGINFTNYKNKNESQSKEYNILEITGEIEIEEFKVINKLDLNRINGLHLIINETEKGLHLNFYYQTERFTIDMILQWSQRYQEILSEILI